MSNKIIKSVSFNKTNSQDQRILKAISRRNFSGYVKKLILADLDAKGTASQSSNEQVMKKAENAADKLARLKAKQSDNHKE